MKKIRDSLQVIGMLERGVVAGELSDAIEKTLQILQDAAGGKGKATGSVTLKLDFTVQGSNVEIEPAITTKHPKVKRPRTFLFVTADGALSTEHPQQLDMLAPREVTASTAYQREA